MSRVEMADFAEKLFDYPSKKLTVIGVTGTSGKTSVTCFVHNVLLKMGFNSYLAGTLSNELTTAESLDIQDSMAQHVAKGGTHYVMEISSHSIDQKRIKNIEFDIKLLTNLGTDHLDYHKTVEAYHEVKKSFMREYPGISIYPKDYLKEELNFKSPVVGQFNLENLQAAQAILRALCPNRMEEISKFLSESAAPPGRL